MKSPNSLESRHATCYQQKEKEPNTTKIYDIFQFSIEDKKKPLELRGTKFIH